MDRSRWFPACLSCCLLTLSARGPAAAADAPTTSVERAAPAFAKADADRDGKLTREEFLKDRVPADVAERDFLLFDRNTDAALSPDEFCTIPTVLPPDQRGPLPDPMQALVDSVAARLDVALENWNEQPQREFDTEGFIQGFTQAFGAQNLQFEAGATDEDRNGRVSRPEVRRFLEILLGVRRPEDGQLLRLPNGRLVNYRVFIYADENHDDRLDRREFVERTYGGPDVAAEFEKVDKNRNGVISFDEWRQLGGRALLDPVQEFRQLDKNFDARVDPEELAKGTPSWKSPLPQHVFPAFDVDRDGTLSLAEYRMTPQANLLMRWHLPPNDQDDSRTLSFQEFRFEQGQFPLLRLIYFHRLDTNSDGVLQRNEFTFRTRMPEEFFTLSADGSAWRPLLKFEQFKTCGSPAVSPDGQQLAFDARELRPQSDSGIYVVSLAGGEPRMISSGMMPNWLSDGRRLACSRNSPTYGVWIMDVEGEEHQFVQPGWGAQISPDGKSIAYTDGPTLEEGPKLKIFDISSKEIRTVLDGSQHPYQRFFWNSGWSPDSRRLCLKATTKDERQVVLTVNMIGDDPGLKVHLTGKASINPDFAWHPGGKRIVFPMTSEERGCMQLYEFDPDAADPPTLVKGQDDKRHINGVCWTPDGKQMIVTAREQ